MGQHKFSIIPGRAAQDRRVTDSIYRTLSALCMYADKDGWCFPAQGTLAEDIGKTRKTVNEHLQLLEAWGYVRSEYRPKENNSPTSKRYQVVYDTFTQPMSTPDYSPYEYPEGYTNDPYNDPSNNTANDEKSVVADLPIEWQIAAGKEITKMPDNNDAKYVDAANLIAMSFGGQAEQARGIALAFMRERKILIPNSKIKAQRKAVKEMLEMGVRADHVAEAVWELQKNNMTVVDLYSVSKTAINLANLDAGSQTHSKFEGV